MVKEVEDLKSKLEIIKKKDYIKGVISNSKSDLKTLYNELNCDVKKTYPNIEIKIKHNYKDNYITIFNAKPEGKDNNQIKRIRDKYGYIESLELKKKVFKESVQANTSSFINSKLFKLNIDYKNLKVYLGIYNKDYTLIDCKSYWTFDNLRKNFELRSDYLFLIKAWDKLEDKTKYYKYYDYSIYKKVSFKEFLDLLEEGTIRVTFRIDIYKKGSKIGEIIDKGTSFEIQEIELEKLFKKIN